MTSMLALSLAGLAPIAIYSQKLARMSGVRRNSSAQQQERSRCSR